MEHPADDVLLRFFLGTSSRKENRAIVIHLLARCPRCAAALQEMRRAPVDARAYDEALERFFARVRERAAADGGGRLARFHISGGATRKRRSG